MTSNLKILIVDDHVVLRNGLASLLNLQPGFEIVGEAGTVAEAVMKASELMPDLILMDIELPDGTGVEATKTILSQFPDINILMLTIYDSDQKLMNAIRNGAKGYLLKNTTSKNLIETIRAMGRGEVVLSREMTGRVMTGLAKENTISVKRNISIEKLTARELEILKEVSSGATNKEIAEHLFISVNTVKNHVHEILDKLGLKNRHEAALFAIEHELNKPVS